MPSHTAVMTKYFNMAHAILLRLTTLNMIMCVPLHAGNGLHKQIIGYQDVENSDGLTI